MVAKLGGRDKSIVLEPLEKDFSIIRDATNNFSEENRLGRGAFGIVYKGILATGQQIAVKRLDTSRLESRSRRTDKEFKNEVRIAARIQHTNLAELLGFCLEGEERLLIFEFVCNGSLDKILFDETRRVELDWAKRFTILKGIAQGLLYLHQHSRNSIIHRDLKPDNVLLDEHMRPKITDFGTARLFPANVTHETGERLAGTPGYIAPEFTVDRKISYRLDVYSFGILVLEIVAGRRSVISDNSDPEDWLMNRAWTSWVNTTPSAIVDPIIASEDSLPEMKRCIHIAMLCIQKNADSRPEMSRVLHMLTTESPILESPSPPPYVQNSC